MSLQPKKKIFVIAAVIAVITIGAIGYMIPVQSTVVIEPTTLAEDVKTSDAIDLARNYVQSSPTFSFDGIPESLDLITVNILESYPEQYVIEFAFESSNSGFGNRDGQMLAQMITPHKISLLISDGQVISAVTDEMWDEQNHQYVLKPQSKLQSSSESPTEFDRQIIDYDSLISALESRGLEVKQTEVIDDSMFTVPTKVISAGGVLLQIYEFDSELDTKNAVKLVSEDGTKIGTNIIRWMDVPHFYNQGKIIVQYIGHNPEILNILDYFLGNQFAGM